MSQNRNRTAIQIVWFKRDLRLSDHAPLKAAMELSIPTLFIYFHEPTLTNSGEYDLRHGVFIQQSIQNLNLGLEEHGLRLEVSFRDCLESFERLRSRYEIKRILSHMETGQGLTFDRDLAVGAWCKKHGIEWLEYRQAGVIRGLRSREKWSREWSRLMSAPQQHPELDSIRPFDWQNASESIEVLGPESAETSTQKPLGISPESLPKISLAGSDEELQMAASYQMQRGGEALAHSILESFLQGRARNYVGNISKPEASRLWCSRISPYLAWGNISMRQVYQQLSSTEPEPGMKRGLSGFRSRLFWRDHFTQKLESEPRLEFENLNRGYDVIRQKRDESRIEAWEKGMTGIPLVDACLRCVAATGYLNFRMRAMVASCFTHLLWQPWQAGSAWLARQFLDYEPGIHFSQFQMQAGAFGVNTFRVYNPVKQAQDHDPEARFIKFWIPELRELPAPFAIAPWTMTPLEEQFYNYRPGISYPKPIIGPDYAATRARKKLHEVAKTPLAKEEATRILRIHVNPNGRRQRLRKRAGKEQGKSYQRGTQANQGR